MKGDSLVLSDQSQDDTGDRHGLEAKMSAIAPHRATATIPPGMPSYTGLFSFAAIELWWVKIPEQLRIYSRTLWAVWTDGMYLTPWSRLAMILPLGALLLGFVEGATHWSLLTLGNDKVSLFDPPVIFAQSVPLLFIAVLLGSLSAHLGLMLVCGYALGDYLIAGPVLTILNPTPISGFLHLRVPQLLCYALFLTLAATPPLASNGLLHPFARRLAGRRLLSVIVRTAALAAVTMTLVYGWTLVAPLVFRLVWSWPGEGPPLSVKYFREVLNPWLPITAGLGIVARTVFVWRAHDDQQLQARTKRVLRQAALADGRAAWPRRLPAWFRAVLSALWPAFLLAGMVTTWLPAVLVGSALVALFLLRNCVLPKINFWARWTRKVAAIPLIFRIAMVVVATYVVTQGLLQIPGWTISQNAVPGQFGTLLACAAASLLINLVAIPYAPAGSTAAEPAPVFETTPEMRVAVQVVLLAFFLFWPLHAFAVCNDPSCCFGGDNGGAGGPLAAMGGGMAMGAAGGIGGSGEGGSGGEGDGSSGAPDGGGDDPAPSSNGGPSGEGGGGGGGSSASGSSPAPGGSNSSSFGSASGPSDSNSSAPSSSSDQGAGNGAGPGSASSPGDRGTSAPGTGQTNSSGPSSGSSPGSEASNDPSASSPTASSTDDQPTDDQQEPANSLAQQAAQDQQNASELAQEAAQNQQEANLLAQEAAQDQQNANELAQEAAQNQQEANELAQEAATEQDPETAAAEQESANELAATAQAESEEANNLIDDAELERNEANDFAQTAENERQAAADLAADSATEQNASNQLAADQASANAAQGEAEALQSAARAANDAALASQVQAQQAQALASALAGTPAGVIAQQQATEAQAQAMSDRAAATQAQDIATQAQAKAALLQAEVHDGNQASTGGGDESSGNPDVAEEELPKVPKNL